MDFFWLWVGLCFGSFVGQVLLGRRDWSKALDRSIFQGVALALAYMLKLHA